MARATCSVALVVVATAACATRGGFGRFEVRADVVGAPRVVPTASGELAVYEVELRNAGERTVRVERVVQTRRDGGPALDVTGAALERRFVPRVRTTGAETPLTLRGGQRAVVLLEAAIPPGRDDPSCDHAVTLSLVGGDGSEELTAARRPIARGEPLSLGPPVAGSRWLVENGPATLSGHRRAVVWIRGAPRAAQRFAIDLFRVGDDGRTSTGAPGGNASYHGFGAEVLAVADGTVAAAVDGVTDNAPHPTERAVEMTAETVAGNHVVLDVGGGRFVLYGHLLRGSVAVRAGERVRRGQVVGRLGNSGNSTEPHLHLHVADGPSHVDASGLPFVFDAYRARDAHFGGVLPDEGSIVSFDAGANHATSGAPSDSATR